MAQSILDLILRTKKVGSGDKEAESGLSKLASGFKSVAGTIGAAVGSFAAVSAAIGFSVSQAAEAERVMAQTEAVIKATGGAAGMTAQEIADLAEAESKLTGIDDEVIQSGENMLLTFKNIGESTFPRATRAMEDMAVAMAQGDASAVDLKGSAIQLGKALNDPVAGITALTRVGVTFTDKQKAMIRTMVEAGDVAGAQAVILDELESEFGGAAQAAGSTFEGALNKAKVAVGNLGAAFGERLLPSLKAALGGFTELTDRLTDIVSGEALANFEQGLLDTNEAARQSSGTYEAYVAQIQEAVKAQNLEIDASGNLVRKLYGMDEVYDDVIQSGYVLTEQEWELVRAAENSSTAFNDAGVKAAGMGSAFQDVAPSAEDLKQALDDLQLLIKGPVGAEIDTFIEKQQDLEEEAEDLKKQIADLNAQPYLTKAQKEQLNETVDKLADNQQALRDLKQEHTDTTEQILFNILQQQLAIDGFTKQELDFLNEVAYQWGLIDENTANALRGMDDALAAFNAGDINGALDLMNDVRDTALDIPRRIDITVGWIVEGAPPGFVEPAGGGTSGKSKPEMEAMGGPVYGGRTYGINEPGFGPEYLVMAPGQNGYVLNAMQARQAMAEAGPSPVNNFYLTYYEAGRRGSIFQDIAVARALAGV